MLLTEFVKGLADQFSPQQPAPAAAFLPARDIFRVRLWTTRNLARQFLAGFFGWPSHFRFLRHFCSPVVDLLVTDKYHSNRRGGSLRMKTAEINLLNNNLAIAQDFPPRAIAGFVFYTCT